MQCGFQGRDCFLPSLTRWAHATPTQFLVLPSPTKSALIEAPLQPQSLICSSHHSGIHLRPCVACRLPRGPCLEVTRIPHIYYIYWQGENVYLICKYRFEPHTLGSDDRLLHPDDVSVIATTLSISTVLHTHLKQTVRAADASRPCELLTLLPELW